MERDLDILMLRQQIEDQQPEHHQQPDHQQDQQHNKIQVWRNGEKPQKTVRQPKVQSPDIDTSHSTIQNKKHTRDSINTRMGHRDLLVQVSGNPFLSNNNYVHDIANRDQYLLARDSNFN